ncbi:putative surface protease GP63 [Trypanosoma theileri]|uniref:Leishmanolysin-like peptidase n=1 Tax=Trypanosoma theileri TaxID=67003 RepID=A0A1X0PB04_9TRYP|nr:putative surface protease GP63 [Trypanosoma theileri]ORC93759.1 putative surface protease GP63 [Trypanosoma theileri]
MTRQMHVSLFLLLLLCLFVQLCSTSGILAAPSAGVVQEVPLKGQSGVQAYTVSTGYRHLIRIVTSTKDLENKRKYCSAEGMPIWDFDGNVIKCHNYHVLKTEDVQYLKNEILPAAVKLHADRLRVDPVKGSLVVPEFEEESTCSYFTVPVSHHCKGVNNSDMVLYVAAKPVNPFATICANASSGRPIAAAMNFRVYRKYGLRYNVRLATHEIAHALGFDYQNFVDNKMVSTLENLRGKSRVVVVSPRTLEEAKKHYGCGNLKGVHLVSSHWDHRIAKDELMSSYTVFGAGYYTALTMSVFDDLPYYSANWGMEEPMAWGNNSGCEFINGACTVNTENTKTTTKMFCSRGVYSQCTSDRFAVGSCTSVMGYRVYTEPDECPFAKPEHIYTPHGMLSALCTLTVNNTIPGSVTGNDSWCLDGDSLKVKVKGNANKVVGGVCVRVSCDEGKVKVMYAGNDKWHDCPEGGSITPLASTSTSFVSGKIKCPKYREVCTMTPDGGSRLIPKTSEQKQ